MNSLKYLNFRAQIGQKLSFHHGFISALLDFRRFLAQKFNFWTEIGLLTQCVTHCGICKSVGVQTSLKILKYQLSIVQKMMANSRSLFSKHRFYAIILVRKMFTFMGLLWWLWCWIEMAVVDPSIVTLIVCKATLFMHLSDPSWSLREKQTFFAAEFFLWVLYRTHCGKIGFSVQNLIFMIFHDFNSIFGHKIQVLSQCHSVSKVHFCPKTTNSWTAWKMVNFFIYVWKLIHFRI